MTPSKSVLPTSTTRPRVPNRTSPAWIFAGRSTRTVKAEYAQTNAVKAGGVEQDGSAHSIELEHNSEKIDVRAAIREVDDTFGLGYQLAADKGFRRLPVEARGRISDHWSLDGEAGLAAEPRDRRHPQPCPHAVALRARHVAASLGLTHAEDKFEDGENRNSELVEVGLSKRLGKLRLRASSVTEAGQDDTENTDFDTFRRRRRLQHPAGRQHRVRI